MSKTRETAAGSLYTKILPVMAWSGIVRNGNVYYPYLAAGIFSTFIYFVFGSILYNDIIRYLPKSAYAWMMLRLGRAGLSLILFFFLVYANGFLVKRRRREFGLYHILGLEKKHIGCMFLLETLILYAAAMGGGILFGTVLAKLMFLILLKICRLSADVPFVFEPQAFKETLIYFGAVYGFNFVYGLIQVGKARPVELMSGSRKGEKEPGLLWVYALLGAAALCFGYYCSVTSRVDSMIFMNFLGAVVLVVTGTYLLFTSGSIAFLKWLRSKKPLYYRPKNFITVSGMLYRMKKSAAGLANLCIFSTMVIITLVCTLSLCINMDAGTHFAYPYDLTLCFRGEKLTRQALMQELGELEEKYGIGVWRADLYDRIRLSVRKTQDRFLVRKAQKSSREDYEQEYGLLLLTQEDYNGIAGSAFALSEEEALIYCSSADYGYDTVDFFGMEFAVKEEVRDFYPNPKADGNDFNAIYVMVVKDETVRDACVGAWAAANGMTDETVVEDFLADQPQYVQIYLAGEDQEKRAFLNELQEWGRDGVVQMGDDMESRNNLEVQYGSLLFLGILFGLIFFMCLILVMYYKQISEGYEDRDNFGIMQKVGMSDLEIRATVHRQIFMVFGLPLGGALLHTAAGMFMVRGLMTVLSLFDTGLLVRCTVGVSVLFMVIYGVSYLVTAKTYYKIVYSYSAMS